MNESLKELLIQTQEGNQESYKLFLKKVIPLIEKKVNKTVFNKSDRPDLIQEILMSIHQSLATYDSAYDVEPWLYTITQRRIIDYIRRIARHQKFNCTEEFDVTNHIGQANIQSEMENYEILNILSNENRKAILLTKLYGHSTAEVAAELNIKENALRTRLSRAFKEIENYLKKEL
ncbi:MAG: hypothetical protein CME63_09500 [Halobacteriovoraceae bacterium]|nr:hypothetical protein [Halobacteriovoraceae bacterium]MBC97972.1 hypothetical protein [Halobacteriovoraceae bacterium]|tara:strand:- start:179745 stop:180272 length:528 start_codon:yes stop_codon:yes gene_type:complete